MREQKAELARLLKKPDEVVWEQGDTTDSKVRFDAFDADDIERKYNRYMADEGPRSVVLVSEEGYTIDFGKKDVQGRGGATNMRMSTPDGTRITVTRSSATDELIRLMMHRATGLVSLCYHRYNAFVDMETGRAFDTRDDLTEYIEGGREPEGANEKLDRELFIPTTDNIESPHQDILRREHWHTEILEVLMRSSPLVLVYLKWRDVPGNSSVVMKEKALYFYWAGFKFLYHFCWDNRENRKALSDRRTIDFIFSVLERLEKFKNVRAE
eukprot:2116961-Prymnesium_polylepis.1